MILKVSLLLIGFVLIYFLLFSSNVNSSFVKLNSYGIDLTFIDFKYYSSWISSYFNSSKYGCFSALAADVRRVGEYSRIFEIKSISKGSSVFKI